MNFNSDFYFIVITIAIIGRVFNFCVWWSIAKKISEKNKLIIYIFASLLCPMIITLIIWIIACKPKLLQKESLATEDMKKYKEQLLKIK